MINILKKFSIKETKRRFSNLKGILSRDYAYKGPDVVQIDLTDKCNSRCLICWVHSPFIRRGNNTAELEFSKLKGFLNEIARSGTREVIFSGGGEPFVYPYVWETLELADKLGFFIRINTNFVLLDESTIKHLLSFNRLLSLTVSIWASNASLYSKLHNREPEVFYRVKDNLRLLNASRPKRLQVKMLAIINNLNYSDLKNLAELSCETGCDGIEFGIIDAIPQITDSFLLNEEQLKILQREFFRITGKLNKRKKSFNIINREIFLRRILNAKAYKGEYDTDIDKFPCFVGWFFLRLRANGDFNSCLKSHRIPIGNLYRDGFPSVWNNSLQHEFRKKSVTVPKDKLFFRFIGNGLNEEIGCRRGCDNFLMNRSIYRLIKFLSVFKR